MEESHFDLADLVYLYGFSHLSEICLNKSTIGATGGPLIDTPSLPSLRYLSLMEVQDHAMPAAIEMISSWPHLERLNFGCYDERDSFQKDTITSSQTRDVLRQFQPLHLSYLTLPGIDLTDQDLARVLDGCPSLTNLVLSATHVGEASFSSLANVSGTLTSLNLKLEKGRGYWTPRRLLCCLPKLVEFGCSRIDVDEMFFGISGDEVLSSARKQRQYVGQIEPEIEGRPGTGQAKVHLLGQWTCMGLRQLQMDKLILSLDDNRNQAFMDQLGRLQRMTRFRSISIFR